MKPKQVKIISTLTEYGNKFNEQKIKGNFKKEKVGDDRWQFYKVTLLSPVYSSDYKYVLSFGYSNKIKDTSELTDLFNSIWEYNVRHAEGRHWLSSGGKRLPYYFDVDTSKKELEVFADFGKYGKIYSSGDKKKLLDILAEAGLLPKLSRDEAVEELKSVGITVQNGKIKKADLEKAIELLRRLPHLR